MVVVDDVTSTTTTTTTATATATAVKINIKCKTEMDRKLLVAAIEGDIEYLDSIRRSSSVCGIQSHASNNVTTQSSSTSIRKGKGTKKSTKEIVTISTGIEILRTTVCSSGCTLLHWAAGSNQVNVLEYLTQPIKSRSKSHQRQRQKQKEEEEDKDDSEESVTNNDKDNDDDDEDDDDDVGVVIFKNVNLIVEYKKSYGRTPLHYACRNGSLEAVQYLCLSPYCHAIPDIKAKQGVTPFQLAIWQNHLQVCQFLTTSNKEGKVGIIPSIDFNDFGCGAIHWIGIAPKHRANFTTTTSTNENEDENNENDNGHDLLPLIKWLSKQDGINFFIKQRQGHTALHKAVWGGHMSVVKYLREEIGMFDDQQDDAGNYAASLADMANTPRHTKIGVYLRQHCSRKRYNSLQILGLTTTMSKSTLALDKNEIRNAYLKKARQLHPDRLQVQRLSITKDDDDNQMEGEIITKTPAAAIERATSTDATFDELYQAYIHLTEEDGIGDQVNPAHSLNRMLRYVNSVGSVSVNVNDNKNDKNVNDDDEKKDDKNDADNVDVDSDDDDSSSSSFFKARLIAVLLEYGDKGIDLSNVKKKWKQVWPKIPFPSQQQHQQNNDDNDNDQKNKVITATIPLVDFLLQKAGDVIRIERIGNKNRRVIVHAKHHFGFSSKEHILREGSITKATA